MKTIKENEAYTLYQPEPGSRLYRAIEEATAAEKAHDEMSTIVADLKARHAAGEAAIAAVDWTSDIEDVAALFAGLPVLAQMLAAAETVLAARLRRLQVTDHTLRGVRNQMESYASAITQMEEEDEQMGKRGRDVRHERMAQARESLELARAAVLTA